MSSSSLISTRKGKKGLGWMELMTNWSYVVFEVVFQKIVARNLQNPLPLPCLSNVNCIVTGCTSGIGLEMAKQLAMAGAHVVMAVRNKEAAYVLIQKWQDEWRGLGFLSVEVMELNLLSFDSIVKFAEAWNSCSKPLHVLINNAGIYSMGQPQRFSKDGFETHLQVNHLAPALLSILLLPSLIKGFPSRIVNVNSVMHLVGYVEPNDMNFVSGERKYTSLRAYSSSKLAHVMFSSSLQRSLPAECGISIACAAPGSIRTNVGRDLPKIIQLGSRFSFNLFNPQEGSRSALFAATDPQILKYYKSLKANNSPLCAYISYDCSPTKASKEAHNMKTAHDVWEKTLDMIGLPADAVEKLIEGKEVKCR